MRISKNNLDMLYRVALAGVFTSPSTKADYDGRAALAWLERNGLYRYDGRSVITLAGRQLLEEKLDPVKLADLRRMEARRDERQRNARLREPKAGRIG